MQIVVALTAVPILFGVFIPESWRWMASAGKVEEAKIAAVELAQKCRGAVLNTGEKEELENAIDEMVSGGEDKSEKKSSSIVDVFRDPTMRWVTINLMYNWFVNSMVYYGLALNAGSLPGSDFMNNAINGLMEIPSYMLIPFMLESRFFGRAGTLAWLLILGGTVRSRI